MTQHQRELDELQKRIDQRLMQLEGEKGGWRPVAVSIDGGNLRYAEVNLTMPEPNLTRFGEDPEREFLPSLGEWQMEVEGFVEPTCSEMTFRFGADILRQPLEGKGYLTRAEQRYITGEWVTYVHSDGSLTYHHDEGEPDRG